MNTLMYIGYQIGHLPRRGGLGMDEGWGRLRRPGGDETQSAWTKGVCGNNPLQGCSHKLPFTSFAAADIQESRSAEDEVLCRGVGPRIWGMQQRVPTKFLFLSRRRRRRVNMNVEDQ